MNREPFYFVAGLLSGGMIFFFLGLYWQNQALDLYKKEHASHIQTRVQLADTVQLANAELADLHNSWKRVVEDLLKEMFRRDGERRDGRPVDGPPKFSLPMQRSISVEVK